MLHEFLTENRSKILALARAKTVILSESKPTSKELERGLPQFYDHLIGILRKESQDGAKIMPKHYAPSTTEHGKESLRLGYTLSQVVHGYGVICQAITETAQTMETAISVGEFSTLNLSLDVAIAEAVTEFARSSQKGEKHHSTEKIGSLVHELRNALTCATIAQSLIKKGVVGAKGSTNAVLERNLHRMRDLLDRSFFEIRLENEPEPEHHPMQVMEAIDDVVVTASEEARLKDVDILVEVDHKLEVSVDSNYLVSALSNLVQNAVKFSKRGGTVWVRSREQEENIVLEVEDQCGGLPKGKAEELFEPFTQKNRDRTGLGLGLSISRRAVLLNQGLLSVRNIPGEGCVFFITLPKIKNLALAH